MKKQVVNKELIQGSYTNLKKKNSPTFPLIFNNSKIEVINH